MAWDKGDAWSVTSAISIYGHGFFDNDDCDWARSQFPVRVAFATTINKSQGQTLQTVGVWLRSPVFSHGQLYVVCCQLKNRQPSSTQVCHKTTRRTRVTSHGQCCLETSASLAVLAKPTDCIFLLNMKKKKKKKKKKNIYK